MVAFPIKFPGYRFALGFLVGGFAIMLTACGQTTVPARNGVIDLNQVEATRALLAAEGEWLFVPDRFVQPEEVSQLSPDEVLRTRVPGAWTDNREGQSVPPLGYGSYILTVENLPPRNGNWDFAIEIPAASTAYRLFLNGQMILKNGQVGRGAEKSRPSGKNQLATISVSPETKKIEILLHLSNYEDLSGGLWITPLLGEGSAIRQSIRWRIGLDFFLFGSLFIMGIYHLVLYFSRRRDITLLLFSTICVVLALRSLTTGERFLYEYSWAVVHRLEYLTFYASVGLFPLYFQRLYPGDYYRPVTVSLAALSAIFVLSLLLPSAYYTRGLVPFQGLTLLIGLYGMGGMFLALWRRRDHAWLFAAGSLVFVFCGLNDILYNLGLVITGGNNLTGFGLIAFILFQSALLAARLSRAFQAVEDLTETLRQQSDSFRRFVPDEFIQVLARKRVTDVQLGDASDKYLSVLFADIRQFTNLSEGMSVQDVIQFLNAYLQRVEPYIARNQGFVDKFVGDAVMALFPSNNNSRQNALGAATQILRELAELNKLRAMMDNPPISIGIGLHYGDVMLGTIGTTHRIDTTAVGDTVNTAARLESLTKLYRSELLVSQAVAEVILNGAMGTKEITRDHIRHLDTVRVKGKTEVIDVYEVFAHLPEEVRQQKAAQRADFDRARSLYLGGAPGEARDILRLLIDQAPNDHVYKLYYNRAVRLADKPPSAAWDRVHQVR